LPVNQTLGYVLEFYFRLLQERARFLIHGSGCHDEVSAGPVYGRLFLDQRQELH
jgi:hypothetical protein